MLKIEKPVLIYALCNFGGGGFRVEVCVCLNFQVTQRFCQNKLLFNCPKVSLCFEMLGCHRLAMQWFSSCD